ncbi:MAG: 2-hydroxyacid dehydrogenase [Cyanobacteria bacterium P01_F01_bin.42]
MKVVVFSARPYDHKFLDQANKAANHQLTYCEARLSLQTASLCQGADAVCAFINDDLSQPMLSAIAEMGVRFIALRCAGYNNVDLPFAQAQNIPIVRVPAYSPYAVAEHTTALILALNRKIYRAYNRVREDNFLLDGLLGFDLHGSTVGIVGTGKIGQCFAQIMAGFGCNLLAYDLHQNPDCLKLGVRYVELNELIASSRVISLHCPLLPDTYHLINAEAIALMQPGTMLINTSRGGLVDTEAAIAGIKSGQIGALGIDVYEQEADLFFTDQSNAIIQDDTFQLLQSFPNVVITAHQAFFTQNALENIAQTTLSNLDDLEAGRPCKNQVNG